MSRHDPAVALGHMLAHAEEAVVLCQGKTRQDLNTDRLFELALTRLLEIIGEAASRVPPDVRARYPQIPWRDMIDCRNRLIHGYDVLDHDIIWSIARNDLRLLTQALATPAKPF
jgi:uncharacterized protein with HEPN domain